MLSPGKSLSNVALPPEPRLPLTCIFQHECRTGEGAPAVLCTLAAGVCPLQRQEVTAAGEELLVCIDPHCVPTDWQVVEFEVLSVDETR